MFCMERIGELLFERGLQQYLQQTQRILSIQLRIMDPYTDIKCLSRKFRY